jgi:hypothetical protein
MIPKHARNRAMAAALVAFGLLLIGVIVGLAWVNTYAVR